MSARCAITTLISVVAAAAAPTRADAPLVHCMCSEGEWHWLGSFAYYVDSASYPMMEFTVATNDPSPANYTNVHTPPGWQFAVEPPGMVHTIGQFAMHGEMSAGPCTCPSAARIRWWTDDPALAVESFVFSYSHPWRAEDVGWILTTQRPGPPPEQYVFIENWGSPVGWGTGPLHAPYAPPAPCDAAGDCPGTDFCHKADGDCDGDGVCWPRPLTIPPLWQPICGCDGLTYANRFAAAHDGVNVRYPWSCEAGDMDEDGDVGFDDFEALTACLAGPEIPLAADCELADVDVDYDVDVTDFRAQQVTYAPPPALGSYGHGPCVRAGFCEADEFVFTPGPGTLATLHRHAEYNCCLDDIAIALEVAGSIIELTETEVLTQPCFCVCCYEVSAAVINLAPGTYIVRYHWYDYETGSDQVHEEAVMVP